MEPEPIENWEKRVKCYSGDWGSLHQLMSPVENWKYDFILTSDTLYNTEYYATLYQMIKSHLKKDGIALVAAKTYYFGKKRRLFILIQCRSWWWYKAIREFSEKGRRDECNNCEKLRGWFVKCERNTTAYV